MPATTARLTTFLLIPPRPHTFRREDIIQIAASTWTATGPLLDSIEHVSMHLAVLVSRGGMVEDLHAVVQDLLDRDVGVIPRIHDAGRHELQDLACHLPGGLVEDIAEVVFAQHRVGRVRAVWVGPGFVLVFPA